jgi:predicted metal-dependent hydrolase
MQEIIKLGDVVVALTRKDVKHVHLSVHPPVGRVTLVAPRLTRLEVARAYAISRLGWIRDQRAKLAAQARESPRQFIDRESHYVWGRRYLLSVVEAHEKPSVILGHRKLTLRVRPVSSQEDRVRVFQNWQRSQMHLVVPALIRAWERRLGVTVAGYFLQRMRTKWGSCNPESRHIRLNTELIKKPRDLLEYVVVHEMAHLLEPSHSARFVTILDRHYPAWREARLELNALPLST